MLSLISSIDPGTRKMGLSVTRGDTGKTDLIQVDLHEFAHEPDGRPIKKLTSALLPDVVLCLVRHFHAEYFSKTKEFVIERQIPATGCGWKKKSKKTGKKKESVKGNALVWEMSRLLYVSLASAYPRADVYWSSPKQMRAFHGTTVRPKDHPELKDDEKKIYNERKRRNGKVGYELIKCPATRKRMRTEFGSKTVDPVDAFLHCRYFVLNPHKFKKVQPWLGPPPVFPTVKGVTIDLGAS